MNIRKATMMDKDEIYAMICDLEEETMDREAFDQALWENINNPFVLYLVALKQGEVVGFASLHVQKLLHHLGNVGEIQELVVMRDHRKQGIGQALYQALKQKAIDFNCLQLEVSTHERRNDALQFYEKQQMINDHRKLYVKLL